MTKSMPAWESSARHVVCRHMLLRAPPPPSPRRLGLGREGESVQLFQCQLSLS